MKFSMRLAALVTKILALENTTRQNSRLPANALRIDEPTLLRASADISTEARYFLDT